MNLNEKTSSWRRLECLRLVLGIIYKTGWPQCIKAHLPVAVDKRQVFIFWIHVARELWQGDNQRSVEVPNMWHDASLSTLVALGRFIRSIVSTQFNRYHSSMKNVYIYIAYSRWAHPLGISIIKY